MRGEPGIVAVGGGGEADDAASGSAFSGGEGVIEKALQL
jgi:hypothetical protein